jgi:hypothetical protein
MSICSIAKRSPPSHSRAAACAILGIGRTRKNHCSATL